MQPGNPNSDIFRFYQHRPFFVFAYEGAIDSETLIRILSEDDQSHANDAPALDAVAILDRGFAVNLWDGNGAFTSYDFAAREMSTGWRWFGFSDYTLVWLLFWLHSTMPRFAVRSSPLLPYLFPGTTWTPGPPKMPGPQQKTEPT
jgi:hypothetical protein